MRTGPQTYSAGARVRHRDPEAAPLAGFATRKLTAFFNLGPGDVRNLSFLYFATFIMRAAAFAGVAVMQDVMRSLDPLWRGVLFAVYPLAEIATVGYLGALCDRIGRKRILVFALLVTAAAVDRGGRHEVREDEDPLASDAVAQRAEVPDRRDFGERVDREEDPPPQGVERAHHVLHHRDAGERRGPHDERREVQEGEIPDVPRAEVEECRQLAARESRQWSGLGISMANTGSGGIGLRSGSHRCAGVSGPKTQMEILK